MLFVTVGTTQFDALISELDEPCNHEKLFTAFSRLGIDHIVIQLGNGSVLPHRLQAAGKKQGLKVEYFRLKPSIKPYIEDATFVISHAGAGSILETLRTKKPLLVVVNEKLMDNHQLELAHGLGKDNYLYWCTCENLWTSLEKCNLGDLKEYPDVDFDVFPMLLDEQLGF